MYMKSHVLKLTTDYSKMKQKLCMSEMNKQEKFILACDEDELINVNVNWTLLYN